jgi:hypothetical protein
MRYLAKINLKDIKVSESGGVKTSWVQIFRLGKWKHPRYGPLQFTTEILEGFVQNFKDNVRKVQLAIDQEHEPEKGAAGWIKDVVNVTVPDADRSQVGLWALVEWTPHGVQLLANDLFKYMSGDFDYVWKDEETGHKYQNVLFGAALTNRPFIKGMSPINLSEFKDDIENDKDVRNSFQLAEDVIKLKEGDKMKSDAEIMACKDEGELTPEEKARKVELLKVEKEKEVQLAKKKELCDRAKKVGLSEDAPEADIVAAEKKLQENIDNENEQRVKRAAAVGLGPDATLDQIEKAEQAAVKKKADEIEKNKNLKDRAKSIGLSENATEAEIEAKETEVLLSSDVPVMEKRLTEMKQSGTTSALTIKLLEDNIASKKKLHEEQIKGAKEKITNMLKGHWRDGKLTTKERDVLNAVLCADVEIGNTSFKLTEKDKEDKDTEVTRILSDIVDGILKDRPVMIDLKEKAAKELAEPPKDSATKELSEKEVGDIAGRVAGSVTKATKTNKKLKEAQGKK